MSTALLVLLDVALVVGVAHALRGLLGRLRQPPVMAEILAGIVLGASVLGALPGDPSAALFPPDVRAVLAALGAVAVVAYLFGVGAELDAGALGEERRAVAAVAVASFVVPLAAGMALALLLHGSVAGDPPLGPFALFLGTALGVTAFPVLARIVDARDLRDRPAGRVALAAAAAQEFVVWPSLALAVALGGTGAAGGARTPAAVLGFGVAAVAGVLVLARLVVPGLAGRRPGLAAAATLTGLGLSAAATELAGVSLVLGAFLFGATVPAGPRRAALAMLLTRPALVGTAVLLPLFLAVPALRVDVTALGLGGLGVFLLVLAIATGSKLLSAGLAARLAGMPRDGARTVAALMNARGLVELVVLTVGLEAGLLDDRLFTVLVLVALATTFATGPLVDRIARRSAAPRRDRRRAEARPAATPREAGATP